MTAGRRNYGQFCGLAAALDIVGERWTLLIIRELLVSPARFSELQENLTGAGPNLLSERLRELTKRGIVTRSAVVGDGRGTEYRLSSLGEQLRAPVLDLARWGMAFLDEENSRTGESRAAWGFLAVQAMIRNGTPPPCDESYEFHVDDETFHIQATGGRAVARRGPVDEPVIIVDTDAKTFLEIGSGMLTPFDAVVTNQLTIQGPADAIERCNDLIGLSSMSRGATSRTSTHADHVPIEAWSAGSDIS